MEGTRRRSDRVALKETNELLRTINQPGNTATAEGAAEALAVEPCP